MMSRSDQYIGLTNKAKQFLQHIKDSKNFIKEEYVEIGSQAFNSEPLMGIKIWVKPDIPSVNVEEYYITNIQEDPWSSGPMYFCNLKHFIVKASGQVLELKECYSWYNDPMIPHQYNIEAGSKNI